MNTDSFLSSTLARFVADTQYNDLPSATVHMAKLCLLDGIGVSIGASTLGEGCDAFIDLALNDAPRASCTILGTNHKTSAELAAFANGALAHALDYEDSHDGALVHPNAPLIPAALAIAQAYGPVSGEELISAMAVGCDVVVRLGLGLRASLADFGWYPPPLLASFGATAAAAKLLRLNERQVRDAFSLTLCQATCAGEIIHSPASTLRAVRDAFPARTAVTSALLAQRGIRGFDEPFEGRNGFFATFARGEYDERVITSALGKRFAIEEISFKPWPSCRGTHAAIEAALQMRRRLELTPDHVERMVIRGGRMLKMLSEPLANKRQPATAIDAKFSLPFTVATAFVKGAVTLEDFQPDALKQLAVLQLASRIEVDYSHDPSPTSIGASLELHCVGGERHYVRIDHPLGAPSRPMSQDALIAKFSDCSRYAAHAMSTADVDRLLDALLTLERADDIDAHLFQC